MDTNLITYLACICFIFLFGRIFIVPLKKVLKLVLNSILGGITIYIINLVGASFEFHIGLNFFTSIVIRIIGVTRNSLFNCRKIINWMRGKRGNWGRMANWGRVHIDHKNGQYVPVPS